MKFGYNKTLLLFEFVGSKCLRRLEIRESAEDAISERTNVKPKGLREGLFGSSCF